MPGQRMSRSNLQLVFRGELIKATINDAEGRLSKYVDDNHHVALIQSIIQGTDRIKD